MSRGYFEHPGSGIVTVMDCHYLNSAIRLKKHVQKGAVQLGQ